VATTRSRSSEAVDTGPCPMRASLRAIVIA
jgi:hypothetical protein